MPSILLGNEITLSKTDLAKQSSGQKMNMKTNNYSAK